MGSLVSAICRHNTGSSLELGAIYTWMNSVVSGKGQRKSSENGHVQDWTENG